MCANRQTTLGSFGFIKRVSHRGVLNEIILPDISEQPKLECPHCDDKFKNQKGLTVHLKCKHGNITESANVEINNVPLTSSIAEIEQFSNVDSEELQLGVSEAQDIQMSHLLKDPVVKVVDDSIIQCSKRKQFQILEQG